jgi:hypothetical protein
VVPSCGFTFRMAFESMLGPKSCEGFLLLNFTTRFRSDTFVAVFEEGSFLKNYDLFIAYYVFLLLRLHSVLYGSVLGFMMYQHFCILTSWLLSGLNQSCVLWALGSI